MTEDEERALVVAEAKSWINTPYHSNADIKGVGVDCGMLLVRVFVDTGLVAPFDPRPYPAQWNLHMKEERYMNIVKGYAHEIQTMPGPGDVVLFHFGLCYAHGGIIVEWPFLVHALGPGKVHIINGDRGPFVKGLPRKFFSIWPREHATV